jgi:hypothetical protein
MSTPETDRFWREREETQRSRTFFQEAFPQLKEQPLNAKRFSGKFLPQYKQIWESHEAQLKNVDPSLSIDAMRPNNTLTNKEYWDLQTSIIADREKVSVIRDSYDDALGDLVAHTIVPAIFPQDLKTDVLTSPSVYYQQQGVRTCFLANYAMVFTAITGEPAKEADMLNAARSNDLTIENRPRGLLSNGSLTDIPEEALLATFQTPAFKKAFPDIQVGILKLVGADFEDIVGLTSRLKDKATKKNLSFETYSIAAYQSETFGLGWHNAVLLAAERYRVLAHDPSANVGRANKPFWKEDFIKRWAQAHLRSDYIFALKPQE